MYSLRFRASCRPRVVAYLSGVKSLSRFLSEGDEVYRQPDEFPAGFFSDFEFVTSAHPQEKLCVV